MGSAKLVRLFEIQQTKNLNLLKQTAVLRLSSTTDYRPSATDGILKNQLLDLLVHDCPIIYFKRPYCLHGCAGMASAIRPAPQDQSWESLIYGGNWQILRIKASNELLRPEMDRVDAETWCGSGYSIGPEYKDITLSDIIIYEDSP